MTHHFNFIFTAVIVFAVEFDGESAGDVGSDHVWTKRGGIEIMGCRSSRHDVWEER